MTHSNEYRKEMESRLDMANVLVQVANDSRLFPCENFDFPC
jgi:hypothetical protein